MKCPALNMNHLLKIVIRVKLVISFKLSLDKFKLNVSVFSEKSTKYITRLTVTCNSS